MESDYVVSIVLFRMFHYRVDFLNLLKDDLAKSGIKLIVYYGKPSSESLSRKDAETLNWGTEIYSRVATVRNKEIMLQIPPIAIFRSDLTIVMHENRMLINYVFQLLRPALRMKFAFWGHGQNFQSNRPDGFRERFKSKLAHQSDWYFAYTELSKQALVRANYPAERITVFNNTIDSSKFSRLVDRVTPEQKTEFLNKLNIPDDAQIALFCGSIYSLKRPRELLESVYAIRKSVENLHFIIIGAGPDSDLFLAADDSHNWIHYIGMQKGLKKSIAYSVCDVILNPGLVGLHVVDAFSAGRVFITMEAEFHSPEFAYLENGKNGIVTSFSVEEYVAQTVSVLTDSQRRQAIENAARASSDSLSLQNMVNRFVEGIKSTLAS